MDPIATCVFVSHAHTDHLPTSRRKPKIPPKVVCSVATERLFFERIGYHLEQFNSWSNDDFTIEAVPCGHTFDSTIAEIKDNSTDQLIIYTGDINVEDRAYLKGYKPKKCDILIIEATWGDKNYQFPSFEDQINQARNYIQNELDKGYPVALLGYPLGKSQLLNYSLGNLCDIRFSSKSIWKMEQIHRELGLNLFETKKLPDDLQKLEEEDSPWLLFHNHSSVNNPVLKVLKRKCNLKIVGFSGWAIEKTNYKIRMGADAAFIISDHSDYSSLIEIVKESQASKVYTVFGNAKQLAKDLQREGFNAIPLIEGLNTLDNFF
jgi:putative mRNA 3-end processing factor